MLTWLIKDTAYYREPQDMAEVLSAGLHPKSKQWRGQRNCYAVAWAFTSWWYDYVNFVNLLVMNDVMKIKINILVLNT